MMDYRIVRLFSSSSFSCRRKNSDLVRQRSSMRDFFFFFFASNVNTHRLRQNYRAFYEPFYELNIFSSLVCGAVKEVDRNNIVHGYVYTRISFFFYSSLLSFFFPQYEKYSQGTQRKKGNDLSIYSSIVFFSLFFFNICAYRNGSREFWSRATRLLFRATCSSVPRNGNSSHEEIFSRLSSRATLGCKQDQAESFKGNLLVACRFQGFLFHRRRDTSHEKVHYTSDVRDVCVLWWWVKNQLLPGNFIKRYLNNAPPQFSSYLTQK